MTVDSDRMLSRLAEHLYWMGRYIERVENTARMVSVRDRLLLDRKITREADRASEADWGPLVEITGSADLYLEKFGDRATYDEKQVLRFLLIEPGNPGSMLSSMEAARENARVLRALLPREAWEALNELALETKTNKRQALTRRERDAFLIQTVRRCQTLVGLLDGTMNHDAGYRFLELGRLLERADMTTRIIDVYSRTVLESGQDAAGVENNHWVPVLKSLAAYQMYRQRRQARVRRLEALDFLIRDRVFPRACLHCLQSAEDAIRRLPNPGLPRKEVQRAAKSLSVASIDRFAEDPERMSAFVDAVQIDLAKVHGSIAATWFST